MDRALSDRGRRERSVKMESSLCEKPERHASRRLSDHLTFESQKKKVHSLVDKVVSFVSLVPSLRISRNHSEKRLAENLHEPFEWRTEASPSMGASSDPTLAKRPNK